MAVTVPQFKISSGACSRFRRRGGPLLPPPAPRRARRPPGPVLTKVQGAKGRKTYRAFSGLLHQDVLGALGLCADNSTGCELEKHVRRLVGSLPWGFAFLANEMILRLQDRFFNFIAGFLPGTLLLGQSLVLESKTCLFKAGVPFIEYWICQIHSYLQCSALRPGTLVLGNCALSLS